jgi:aspartate carbamoyltransferase catalytic subunit
MKHLLSIPSLGVSDIHHLLDRSAFWAKNQQNNVDLLRGKTAINLFYEPSTRTRISFELAAKKLGMDVINVDFDQSSAVKGETLADTIKTLAAMQIDAFIVRHKDNGVPMDIAKLVRGHVLNAGDGNHEHPTQALLDAYTILQHRRILDGVKIAICGDIIHSRVARSNIHLLQKFGADIRITGPANFLCDDYAALGVRRCSTMAEALKDVEFVMMLRIQRERLTDGMTMTTDDYFRDYGLSREKLHKLAPKALVMHPGPINRGVEIDDGMADDPEHSLILEQVQNGVFVRMACLEFCLKDAA